MKVVDLKKNMGFQNQLSNHRIFFGFAFKNKELNEKEKKTNFIKIIKQTALIYYYTKHCDLSCRKKRRKKIDDKNNYINI